MTITGADRTLQRMPERTAELASDLTVHAARLVRLVRRLHAPSAGIRVLSILDEHGPLGVTALAQLDQCSQPTMTGQVNQLLEQGLVSKQANPADRRSTIVALTDAGHAELRRVRAANADLVVGRLARRPEHVRHLEAAVALLRAVLDDPLDDPLDEPMEEES